MAKTAKEVAKLKREWAADPCWDIETTEGFEEHREELLAYREEMEVRWRVQAELTFTRECKRRGIDLTHADALQKLVQYVFRLEDKVDELEEELRKTRRAVDDLEYRSR